MMAGGDRAESQATIARIIDTSSCSTILHIYIYLSLVIYLRKGNVS
jgi:hypothetical protein